MSFNILVTGGAGYLGSVLVPYLLEKGHKIIVLDNFMYKQTSLLGACHFKNLSVVKGDVRNQNLVKNLLQSVDVIYPLACLTGAPLCESEPEEAKSVILDSMQFLMSSKARSQMVIYPTTNSGYGKADDQGWCDEASPLKPISLYGKLKNQVEELVLSHENTLAFRLATVFGTSPRMRLDLLVNDFCYRACYEKTLVLYESHYRRNFLYIRDAIRAFYFALENIGDLKGETYNVGLNNANLTKKQLAELISEFVPDLSIINDDFTKDPDQRDYLVCNDKINNMGFYAETSIEQGIKELLKSYTFIKNDYMRNF